MSIWIDTHCHLDAPEFDADRQAVIDRACGAGVGMMVVPAVMPSTFQTARDAAHQARVAYALGTHPLFVQHAGPDGPDPPDGADPIARAAHAAEALDRQLHAWADDPRLVAVGEIGLDGFVPESRDASAWQAQVHCYEAQLALASAHGLPAILHVRRSAAPLLKALRALREHGRPVPGGIAHAFNGSAQQAEAFIGLGFKLGFGGAMTFERALQIRRLAQALPDETIVLETDAPDIPPQWLYRTAAERAAGARSRNEPGELPRIAATLAELRGWSIDETRDITTANACAALPRLAALLAA